MSGLSSGAGSAIATLTCTVFFWMFASWTKRVSVPLKVRPGSVSVLISTASPIRTLAASASGTSTRTCNFAGSYTRSTTPANGLLASGMSRCPGSTIRCRTTPPTGARTCIRDRISSACSTPTRADPSSASARATAARAVAIDATRDATFNRLFTISPSGTVPVPVRCSMRANSSRASSTLASSTVTPARASTIAALAFAASAVARRTASAASSSISTATTCPFSTRSPSSTRSSFSTPAASAGTPVADGSASSHPGACTTSPGAPASPPGAPPARNTTGAIVTEIAERNDSRAAYASKPSAASTITAGTTTRATNREGGRDTRTLAVPPARESAARSVGDGGMARPCGDAPSASPRQRSWGLAK